MVFSVQRSKSIAKELLGPNQGVDVSLHMSFSEIGYVLAYLCVVVRMCWSLVVNFNHGKCPTVGGGGGA